MNSSEEKTIKRVSVKVLLIAFLFIASLFLFAFIAHEAVYEQEDVFDQQVHAFVMAHSSPALIRVMSDVTFLGSSYFLFPAYVVLISIFLIRKRYRNATDVSIIAISSLLIMMGLKQVFHRKRPDLPIIKGITTYSFPSGHSLSAFIFCSVVAYFVWKGRLSTIWKLALIALLFLVAAFIGISRIVLNVHYATDVIAGFCLGIVWVILSFWAIRKINARRKP